MRMIKKGGTNMAKKAKVVEKENIDDIDNVVVNDDENDGLMKLDQIIKKFENDNKSTKFIDQDDFSMQHLI